MAVLLRINIRLKYRRAPQFMLTVLTIIQLKTHTILFIHRRIVKNEMILEAWELPKRCFSLFLRT